LLRIRLSRVGKKKQPSYRIVVADSRSPRDGAFLKIIGHYNPLTDPATLVVKEEEAIHWLTQGAQPSDTAAKLLTRLGVMERAGKAPFVYKGKDVPAGPAPKKGVEAAAAPAPVTAAATATPAPAAEAEAPETETAPTAEPEGVEAETAPAVEPEGVEAETVPGAEPEEGEAETAPEVEAVEPIAQSEGEPASEEAVEPETATEEEPAEQAESTE